MCVCCRQRLQAIIRCGIRSGLCDNNHQTLELLVEDADDKLFTNVLHNKEHVLHHRFPGTTKSIIILGPEE